MVLASPPPVDPDDVNTATHLHILYVGTLLLKFDTLRALEPLRSQPNTCIPQILKMQYLQNNGPIVF